MSQPFDAVILLTAIATIESGTASCPNGNDLARGFAGEVSRYQIMPKVWAKYKLLHGAYYTDPACSIEVALQHLEHLRNSLPKEAWTTYGAAAAWHLGAPAYKRKLTEKKPLTPKQVDYVSRVINVYESLVAEQSYGPQAFNRIVSTIRTTNSTDSGKPTR